MGNEFRALEAHSAEYFGDTRDAWWNADYLALVARRWELARVREVLDVGCGVGHWGRVLLGVLPREARVTGLDRDPFWIAKATERAAASPGGERFRYQVGLAAALPFEDASFDLVTCQTVLIHMPDPAAVLDEMIRVTRPGGLVAVAEPNNLSDALLDAHALRAPIDEVVALVRFQLVCERGKAALGEGNNSVGELLPAMFASRGLLGVTVSLNDKATPVVPPYASRDARAVVDELQDFARREFWIWSQADTRRYFLAGGGTEAELAHYGALALTRRRADAEAIRDGTYARAGGTAVCYLVSGRKAG